MDLDLTTQVPIEIDGSLAVTAEEFSIRSSRPMRIRKGANGILGKSKGVFTLQGSCKFVWPKDGPEFDFEELKTRETGFTQTYVMGASRFLVTGCEIDTDEVSTNAENGDVTYSYTFMATGRVQTA